MSAANPITGGKIVSYTGMMVYPARVSMRKLQQRLNPGQYIAPPAGGSVMPRIPFVKSEWEEAAEKLSRQRSNNFSDEDFNEISGSSVNNSKNCSYNISDPQRKLVPPFRPGSDSDRSLVYQRNDAATKTPVTPLQKKLLPYKVRRTASMSLMHGGVRTTGLNMPYPALAVTHSEQLALPTLKEERRDLQWDAADFALNLMPLNMANEYKHLAWHNRSVDLARRLQREMDSMGRTVYLQSRDSGSGNKSCNSATVLFKSKCVRYVQPHSSHLRVEPYTKEEWQHIRHESAEARRLAARTTTTTTEDDGVADAVVASQSEDEEAIPAAYTQKDAFLPFQSFKPHGYGVWNITLRNGMPIMAQMDLKQERLNRKGFGWKSQQNKMWQQDMGTHRYSPDKGYFAHNQ